MTHQTNKPVPQVFESEKYKDGEYQYNRCNTKRTQEREHGPPGGAGRCYYFHFDRLARFRLGDCVTLLLAAGRSIARQSFQQFRTECTRLLRSSHQTKAPAVMQRRDLGLYVCPVNRKLNADLDQLAG